MKKYIIIKPNCREFANHLLNYLSIYAYGIETGVPVQNPAFFEWHQYFNLTKKESPFTKMISSFPAFRSVWKTLLSFYGSYVIRANARCVRLTLGITMSLPPTKQLIGVNTCETTYFIGWHFRNPVGLERYRDILTATFMPRESILKEIEDALIPLQGKRLIGVHLQQHPFKGFEDEPLLVPLPRVRRIIDEYLHEKKLDAKDVVLIIVSDKDVGQAALGDFATHVRRGNDITSLFLLSKCSVVIGSNSIFSNLAAWFGNMPHIVATNEPMDWEYYRNSKGYFENKYATFAQ